MTRHKGPWLATLMAVVLLGLPAPVLGAGFAEARIYIEYNESGNDLGFHVFLDGEDWRSLRILDPAGAVIFEVVGKGGYKDLGLTELFFEGAEPSLDDVPLADLLALFPEGRYRFIGTTIDGARVASTAVLSHAVPDGPVVSALVDDDTVVIGWDEVASTPAGFPQRRIDIAGYQVIVGSFQVTLPADSRQVTLPVELVASLGSGEHEFEVLAIDASGNQTITEGVFTTD